jgi:hypothetical protein
MTGKQFFLLTVSLQIFAAFAFAVARGEWRDAVVILAGRWSMGRWRCQGDGPRHS